MKVNVTAAKTTWNVIPSLRA